MCVGLIPGRSLNMLKKLRIEQFVIIDKLELDFYNGLSILTGETGAGKSILIDAMGFILGAPPNAEYVRQGAEQALLEAIFEPPPTHAIWKFLIKNDLTEPGQQGLVIRRTIRHGGSAGEGAITLNDKPIDVEILRKVGAILCEIHGQFANQSLTDPVNQMIMLDLSGDFPPEYFENVANALHEVRRFERELAEEKDFLSTYRNDLPKTEKVVQMFERIGMGKGFVEEVQTEYAKLLTAKETSETFQSILGQFVAANGVVVALLSANEIMGRQENMDVEKIADLVKFLADALDNVRNSVKEMQRLSPEYDIDTSAIHKYEDILAVLQHISKEHKVGFEGLFDLFEKMSAKRDRLRNGRNKLAELEEGLKRAKNVFKHHAHILTEKRIVAGEALSKSITAELMPLKLMKAEFQITVEERPEDPWTERGFNLVTFMARMNPGSPFSPIKDTASGGELARMILAIKVVLQRVMATPTLIFDEVDTGIGGSAAAAVGERLAQLAEVTQVLAITHSPQVASRGVQHMHVSKHTDGITTTSNVRVLSQEDRVLEISNMLAGDISTEESRAAAKSLLAEAGMAATKRHPPPPAQQDAAG